MKPVETKDILGFLVELATLDPARFINGDRFMVETGVNEWGDRCGEIIYPGIAGYMSLRDLAILQLALQEAIERRDWRMRLSKLRGEDWTCVIEQEKGVHEHPAIAMLMAYLEALKAM